MPFIRENFRLWGIFYILGPGVCVGENVAEARSSIRNKPENYKEKTSAELTFEEPVVAPLTQTNAMC
jgi:hypothetical protein